MNGTCDGFSYAVFNLLLLRKSRSFAFSFASSALPSNIYFANTSREDNI